MTFDYSKLRGRICEKFRTNANFCRALDITEQSLSGKLTNKNGFSQEDIIKYIELLSIPLEELHLYFFQVEH